MPDKAVYALRKHNRAGHLWVFSNEIQRVEGSPEIGDLVKVYDRGRFIGSGMFNPKSLIRVRIYSEKEEELNEEFVARKIEAAYAYRRKVLPKENDFRLIYGESDGLPGLVIDKYGTHFAIQVYSAGFDCRLPMVVNALCSLFKVASIFEKDDFILREPEGLERRERLLYGEIPPELVISENGVRFYVNIASGQKTGYFFDHRLTRQKVRRYAKDRRVLDLFSYIGSFAINAALGGAREVIAVDASADAGKMAKRNAQLNQVSERCDFIVADAFEFLKTLIRRGEKFDLVNLDPPGFIKSQKHKETGIAKYRQINILAMKVLNRGGILVSSSCSHYLFWQDLMDILVSAAQETGKSFVILDRSTQGPDHPIHPQMPETEYLRSLIIQVD
ncbi:MAG: class I SAM-dependent rRNA methyltransferase [candidate division WOR-3 bacterium]